MHLKVWVPFTMLFILIAVSACVQNQAVLTVDGVIANRSELINLNISVEGIAGAEKIRCTLMACPEDNPCCNRCGGSLSIFGSNSTLEIRGQYEGRGIGCSGNNCNRTCYPMETGKKYIIIGALKESYGELYIELKSLRENQ